MLKTEDVVYYSNGIELKGFVAYNQNGLEKKPVVLVVPEWWGNNEYSKGRATMLANLGYFAFAVDMYGNGTVADDPQTAMDCSTPFYKDPLLGRERIEAAIEKVKTYPEADVEKMAAIGYCFGGSMALNAAKYGLPFKGVVSFHGGLKGIPAEAGLIKGKILICHGALDPFEPEQDIVSFKENLDSVGADYKFITYEGATHAFTNPKATENGKKFSFPLEYNKEADEKSWSDMQEFFKSIF